MSSELYAQINYDKAYRKNRLGAAQWVLAHPETFPELLNYCFAEDQGDLSHKAAWVLEFVCRDDLSLLYPHFDLFFERLPLVKKDQSLRPMAHLCELLTLQYYKKNDPELAPLFLEKHKTQMIECSFDWLITDQKVACQVRAMTALYFLGTEFDWIHPELQQIIEQNIHGGSGGYKARGRSVLSQIAKFSK
ncbi:MAG: hypothetical protein AAF489_13525 [Bacteroidota bacterium]